METTPKQHMILIVFGGVLVAAIAVGAVMYFVSKPSTTVVQTPIENGAVVEEPVSTQFDTTLFERPEYKNLDTSLFVRGLLPVMPPGGTGKANIFR